MQEPEVWLRGPIKDIPSLLQPAAHALLQTKEEVAWYTKKIPRHLVWKEFDDRASVGFHLNHLTGVLDRMLTYAKGKELNEAQFNFLKNEGNSETSGTVSQMVEAFAKKVDEALEYLKEISDHQLAEPRTVGRKKLPSTLIGLIFHAAEHSQRHIGQLLVSISWAKNR